MDLDGELLRYMYSVPGWDVWRSYAPFVYADDTLDDGTYVLPSNYSQITCFTGGTPEDADWLNGVRLEADCQHSCVEGA